MDIKQVPHVVIETGGEKIKKSYEQIMERGGDCMFDCGIHKIQQQMDMQFEENVVKAVQKVGIDIDKPQLERALLDAKSFYDDGFKDAKSKYERPKGHWIGGELGHCSVCGHYGCASDIWDGCGDDMFCPNCGADMRSEESEGE